MVSEFAPRKKPRQRRSQILVRQVLDAASAIIAEQGFEALTTNRTADRARVSVGSIYQYFPNKSAIVAALVEDLVESIQADALAMMGAAEPPLAARQIIGPFVVSVLNRRSIILALLPHIDELQRLGVVARPEDMIRRAARTAILVSPMKLRHANVDAALFVIVECLSHLVRRYLGGAPAGLGASEFIALASDLAERFLYDEAPVADRSA